MFFICISTTSFLPPLSSSNGLATSDLDKAVVFAQHFQKNSSQPSPVLQSYPLHSLPSPEGPKYQLPVVTAGDVKEALSLWHSKATGEDLIGYRALRLFEPLHPPIADLFSLMFAHGVWPDKLESGTAIPLFKKKGDP
ncbi:hypothetical protein Ciccas_008496, partial [Cichlidogyrus casuarinus]